MRIIGFDPALRCSGYGIVDMDGKRFTAVDCGVIRNPTKAPVSECLRRVAGGAREVLAAFSPEIGVVEGAFYFKNARTAMVLGMTRGVLVSVLAEQQLPVYEYAPRRAKQVVVGYGNASKEQVALFIANMLSLDVSQIPNDATDAMALAICHGLILQTACGAYVPASI